MNGCMDLYLPLTNFVWIDSSGEEEAETDDKEEKEKASFPKPE
jgi:hypothetical protein